MDATHGEKRGASQFRKRRPPVGAKPGTLILPERSPKPRIRAIVYDAAAVEEIEVTADGVQAILDRGKTTWIDVQGLGDESLLVELATIFGIHPLALEDVVHTPQRPKAEFYEEHALYITRMLRLTTAESIRAGVRSEQMSMFLGQNYVLTFQEQYGDILDPVRNRLRQGKGTMRGAGPDYLGYAILDAVLDGYFPVLEQLGEDLEQIEDQVLDHPDREFLVRLNDIKREILHVRRSVWPQRDAVNVLLREDSPFISDSVRVYMRDCYDHCIQLSDVVETYRELAANLLSVYLTSVANRTNEVMKVLTIMASLFIPLTFIAGVYGMNFERMPELGWRWSYPVFWLVCLAVGVGLFSYFRRKGWLGKDR